MCIVHVLVIKSESFLTIQTILKTTYFVCGLFVSMGVFVLTYVQVISAIKSSGLNLDPLLDCWTST